MTRPFKVLGIQQIAIGGPDKLVARHNGNTVVAFADGHVQVIPIDQAMQQLKWGLE